MKLTKEEAAYVAATRVMGDLDAKVNRVEWITKNETSYADPINRAELEILKKLQKSVGGMVVRAKKVWDEARDGV